MTNHIIQVKPPAAEAYAPPHDFTWDDVGMAKSERAARPDVTDWQPILAEDRARQRWRLLAVQLADDFSTAKKKPAGVLAHGWQTAVARELGVGQTYLWHALYNNGPVSLDVIELAISRTKVAEVFFFGTFRQIPHYRNFRGVANMRPPMGYPGLQRFYDLNCFGLNPTEQERHLLERQEWEGEPTERTYDLFLQALRTVRGVEQTGVRPKAEQRKKRA